MSHAQTCGTWEAQAPAQNCQEHPGLAAREGRGARNLHTASNTGSPFPYLCACAPEVCSQMPQGALNLQGSGVKVVTLGGSALGVVLL